jgi:predicted RNA-binding Zn-ribbon protein involved in translation (DUF1610 family)
MATLHHVCDECGSDFTLRYDESQTEDAPHYCAFCGEMMIDVDENYEDDDE